MVDDGGVRRPLDSKAAKDMEEELNATLRRQVERLHPVDLPMGDFWSRTSQLLDHIEGELNSAVRNEGHTLKSHTASRRQANVRRVMTELARKRLVALLNHAVSSTLRPEVDSTIPIPSLDWNKHDPAEKQFHSQCVRLVESFMAEVGWTEMQKGAGATKSIPKVPQGTQQLDSFVEKPGGLTGRGPPPIEMLMAEERILDEAEMDEEERIARIEAYPEMMELANQEPDSMPEPPIAPPEPLIKEGTGMTLDDLISHGPVPDRDEEEGVPAETGTLVRIRILESSDEPIELLEGELALNEGDVHQLDESVANYLIQSGVAEAAPL